MLSKNEFELPDSNSESEENCLDKEPPDENKPPPVAEVNMLAREFENQIDEYMNADREDIEVVESKDKSIPRGLAPLEDLFNFNDVAKKPTIEPSESDIEECNIRSEDKPKMIKLSKSLLAHIKHKYIDLFKEFVDVFAWDYEDF